MVGGGGGGGGNGRGGGEEAVSQMLDIIARSQNKNTTCVRNTESSWIRDRLAARNKRSAAEREQRQPGSLSDSRSVTASGVRLLCLCV